MCVRVCVYHWCVSLLFLVWFCVCLCNDDAPSLVVKVHLVLVFVVVFFSCQDESNRLLVTRSRRNTGHGTGRVIQPARFGQTGSFAIGNMDGHVATGGRHVIVGMGIIKVNRRMVHGWSGMRTSNVPRQADMGHQRGSNDAAFLVAAGRQGIAAFLMLRGSGQLGRPGTGMGALTTNHGIAVNGGMQTGLGWTSAAAIVTARSRSTKDIVRGDKFGIETGLGGTAFDDLIVVQGGIATGLRQTAIDQATGGNRPGKTRFELTTGQFVALGIVQDTGWQGFGQIQLLTGTIADLTGRLNPKGDAESPTKKE